MKNSSKIVAALLTLILVISMLPVSHAESSPSFINTHWYATNVNCAYVDPSQIDSDTQYILDVLGALVKFVPYEEWLWDFSVCSIYCGIDFQSNGTFKMTMACSAFGEIDTDSYTSLSGTWTYKNNRLIMTSNGERVPLQYSNGKLSLSYYGIGLDFAKA